MLKRFLFASLLCLTGWAGSSNAALLGVCTAASGCGPDFSIGVSSVDFDSSTGLLQVDGTVGNAKFFDGQLQGVSGDVTRNVYGAPFTSNDDFSLSITVNSSGSILSSNMTMNGLVLGDVFPNAAVSDNGTTLSGALITGATIDQIGWDASTIDFTGVMDVGSILYTAYGPGTSGLLNIVGFDTGSAVVWDSDWSSTNATLDVVVPVPAAFWLFLSGLAALTATTRRRNKLI